MFTQSRSWSQFNWRITYENEILLCGIYCMPRDGQNPLAYGYPDPNGTSFTCPVRGIGGVVRVFPHT